MNLQDRIVKILCDRTNDFKPIEEVAKAILALVEEENCNHDHLWGVNHGAVCRKCGKLVPDPAPPTVSEQKHCQKCIIPLGMSNPPSYTCWNTCPCHSPSSGVEDYLFKDDPNDEHQPFKDKKSPPVEPTAPVGWEEKIDEFQAHDTEQDTIVVKRDWLKTFISQTIKNREREIAEGVEKLPRYDGDQYSAGVDEEVDGAFLDRDDVLALINKQ